MFKISDSVSTMPKPRSKVRDSQHDWTTRAVWLRSTFKISSKVTVKCLISAADPSSTKCTVPIALRLLHLICHVPPSLWSRNSHRKSNFNLLYRRSSADVALKFQSHCNQSRRRISSSLWTLNFCKWNWCRIMNCFSLTRWPMKTNSNYLSRLSLECRRVADIQLNARRSHSSGQIIRRSRWLCRSRSLASSCKVLKLWKIWSKVYRAASSRKKTKKKLKTQSILSRF